VEVALAKIFSRTKCLYSAFYMALLNLLADGVKSQSDKPGLETSERYSDQHDPGLNDGPLS
jgi:hypothetical protein